MMCCFFIIHIYNLILLLNLNNIDDENHNDDEIEKTLAILIGLIAGVALIIVFLSFLSKVCEKQRGMYDFVAQFSFLNFEHLLNTNILFLNYVL